MCCLLFYPNGNYLNVFVTAKPTLTIKLAINFNCFVQTWKPHQLHVLMRVSWWCKHPRLKVFSGDTVKQFLDCRLFLNFCQHVWSTTDDQDISIFLPIKCFYYYVVCGFYLLEDFKFIMSFHVLSHITKLCTLSK